MERTARRWVGGAIRFGLVVLALGLVGAWAVRKLPGRGHVGVARPATTELPIGPGDLRILSVDGKVELVLKDDRILAGLSPETVAQIRADMQKSSSTDTGLAGGFASMIKQTVAGAIGTHVTYSVRDIRDIRYVDGALIVDTKSNGRVRLFSGDKVGSSGEQVFREDDARRFIEAVKARRETP